MKNGKLKVMGIQAASPSKNTNQTISELLEVATSRVYAEPAQALPLLQRVIVLARERRDQRSLGLGLLNLCGLIPRSLLRSFRSGSTLEHGQVSS